MALVLPASSGWSTSDRYTLVLAMLYAPLTRVISSFGGTTAMTPFWLTMALSSLRACDPELPAGSVMSGAVNGAQPLAGSTNAASSLSSLPLTSVWAPASAVVLAAVSCAIWPLAVIRYDVITLSLWSWSTTAKSRTVRHGCPSWDVPIAGTCSRPAAISKLASR